MSAIATKPEPVGVFAPAISADNNRSDDSARRGDGVKHVRNENEPQAKTKASCNCIASIHVVHVSHFFYRDTRDDTLKPG